jgi:hypothetical protein
MEQTTLLISHLRAHVRIKASFPAICSRFRVVRFNGRLGRECDVAFTYVFILDIEPSTEFSEAVLVDGVEERVRE